MKIVWMNLAHWGDFGTHHSQSASCSKGEILRIWCKKLKKLFLTDLRHKSGNILVEGHGSSGEIFVLDGIWMLPWKGHLTKLTPCETNPSPSLAQSKFIDVSMMNVHMVSSTGRELLPRIQKQNQVFIRFKEFPGRAARRDPEKQVSVPSEDLLKSHGDSQTLFPPAQLSPDPHLPLSLGA